MKQVTLHRSLNTNITVVITSFENYILNTSGTEDMACRGAINPNLGSNEGQTQKGVFKPIISHEGVGNIFFIYLKAQA